MESIGLIAAMPQECRALLHCLRGWKRSRIGSFRCFRFQIGEHDCLLVQSGIGVKRAMQAARLLVETANLQWLVSFGIAGAVKGDLNIGDVIVASNTCFLSNPLPENDISIKGIPSLLRPLAILNEATWQAAAQTLQPRGARLVSGTAITTRGSQAVHPRLQGLPFPVLEMETWGIAQVAAEKGLPLLALRAVSDGPQAPIPLDLEQIYDEDYNLRIARLVEIAIHTPRLLFQSRSLARNVRAAADNAAVTLAAVLGQPQPVISF